MFTPTFVQKGDTRRLDLGKSVPDLILSCDVYRGAAHLIISLTQLDDILQHTAFTEDERKKLHAATKTYINNEVKNEKARKLTRELVDVTVWFLERQAHQMYAALEYLPDSDMKSALFEQASNLSSRANIVSDIWQKAKGKQPVANASDIPF